MDTIYSLISCRVSSDRQVREGHGLESQEQRCKKYSNEKGYIYEKTFLDEGVSGAILERPAIKQILEHIDKNPNKKYIVIFDDINRIARDIEVHWAIKKEFALRGATVESPNFKFDDTPEGKFIETILAGKSQLDREQNARQVKQKMKARMESGYWCFSSSLCGFEMQKTKEHGKLLVPKQPEARIISEALEGFANDRFVSKVDLLDFFKNNEKFLGIGKRKIDFDFVNVILFPINLNLYAGYLEYPKWEVARRKGQHEAIISTEVFEKIKLKLQKNDKKRPNLRDRIEFPLRRLVHCAICGKKMTGSKVKGKLKYYTVYTCNNKNCTAKPKNIQTHILEDEYLKLLNRMTPENEIIELTGAISLDVWNKSIANLESAQKAIEQEMSAKNEAIEEYIDLIPKTKSNLVKEKYENKIDQLENEISELKRQSFNIDRLNYDEALNEVKDFLGTPAEFWKKSGLEGKFMIHNLIFLEKLSFDLQNGFGTPEISLPFTIKDAFSNSVSSSVDPRRFELLTSSVQARRSTN